MSTKQSISAMWILKLFGHIMDFSDEAQKTSKKKKRPPKLPNYRINLDEILVPNEDSSIMTEITPKKSLEYMLEEFSYKINVYMEVVIEDMIDEFCYELLYILDENFPSYFDALPSMISDITRSIESEINFACKYPNSIDTMAPFENSFKDAFRHAKRVKCSHENHLFSETRSLISQKSCAMKIQYQDALDSILSKMSSKLSDAIEPKQKLKCAKRATLAAELKLIELDHALELTSSRIQRLSSMRTSFLKQCFPLQDSTDTDDLYLHAIRNRLRNLNINALLKYQNSLKKFEEFHFRNEASRGLCGESVDALVRALDSHADDPLKKLQETRLSPKPRETKTFNDVRKRMKEIRHHHERELLDAKYFMDSLKLNEKLGCV